MFKHYITLCCILFVGILSAQHQHQHSKVSPRDSLRGMLTPFRTCYDVTYYNLNITIRPNDQFITGSNQIHYTVVENFDRLQIDLFKNMTLHSIEWKGQPLKFTREWDAVFVEFPTLQQQGTTGMIEINYEGKPLEAKNPPWDGGFVWSKDEQENHWIGVSCEGTGASLWWPNKDHLSDEPDSMTIKCAVPQDLTCVANGTLRSTKKVKRGYRQFEWYVDYPINNYNVTVNIADYANFKDTYTSLDNDKLELDYYVLSYNLEKAKNHFKQVHGILGAFEKYFGKYPFWKDGYALVETPYIGMEHQSAIAYGNDYQRGYRGMTMGPNLSFDYLILHETGHEYFGNSVSCNDLAEMWIHESFTTYMESLYIEEEYGSRTAIKYLKSQRNSIANKEAILGPIGVNWHPHDTDQYYKGSWILHSLRGQIGDDDLFFAFLRQFYDNHKLGHATTEDFLTLLNKMTDSDYRPFINQYLKNAHLPKLLYSLKQDGNQLTLRYKWLKVEDDFTMKMLLGTRNDHKYLTVTNEWQEYTFPKMKKENFLVIRDFALIDVKELDR